MTRRGWRVGTSSAGWARVGAVTRLEGPGLDRRSIEILREACELALSGKPVEFRPMVLKHEAAVVEEVLADLGFIFRGEAGYEKGFYVARSTTDDMVKVGISEDPATRVHNLEKTTGRGMELLASFPWTSFQLEQRVLKRFSSRVVHGEWLRRDRQVDAFVKAASVVAGAP